MGGWEVFLVKNIKISFRVFFALYPLFYSRGWGGGGGGGVGGGGGGGGGETNLD